MADSENSAPEPDKDWHLQLFKKSLLKQAKLREIRKLLGPVDGRTCLDVGGDNGVISYHLRRLGGTWYSVDLTEKAVESIRHLVGQNVYRIKGPELPFEDGLFDKVVIIDMLEHLEADGEFVEECHRVLRPKGELIVNVPHFKIYGLLPPIRHMLGLTEEEHGHVRPGYTTTQLFDLLKDGFDVEEVRTYSRFFVESLDTAIRVVAKRKARGEAGGKGLLIDEQDFERMQKLFRAYALVYPVFRTAALADHLLFLTKGYSLIARARWRPWRPRRAPVLADGRSIAEAALGGKIGTAAPF